MVNGVLIPPIGVRLAKGVVLGAFCLLVLIPFLAVFSTSVAPSDQVSRASGLVLWPDRVDFTAYQAIFAGGVVTRAIAVSAFVTIVGTFASLTCSCLMAYALAQKQFWAGRAILLLLLISLLFSPGLIPSYLMVKQVGLLNSLAALIVPVLVSAFNVIVIRAFFMGIPQELTESARLDGAGEFRIFVGIVLPLSKAVLAVIGLFYAVSYWNSFFSALLYLNDASLWPMQLVLRTYVVNNTAIGTAELGGEAVPAQAALQMAILVVSLIPILAVYPFLQRHFAKGVLVGAVKG